MSRLPHPRCSQGCYSWFGTASSFRYRAKPGVSRTSRIENSLCHRTPRPFELALFTFRDFSSKFAEVDFSVVSSDLNPNKGVVLCT